MREFPRQSERLAWCSVCRVQGGISHDFGTQTLMAHATWCRGTAMAKGVIDADGILNRARPWVHQQAHEIQPFGHLVKLPIRAGGERVQGKRGQSQPAAGRYDHAARPCTRSTTGEWQDRRFVNCMWLEVPHPHSARHAVRVAQRGHGRSHVDGCARQATPAATRKRSEGSSKR